MLSQFWWMEISFWQVDGSLRSRLKNAKEIDSILTSSVIRNLKTVSVSLDQPTSRVIVVARILKPHFWRDDSQSRNFNFWLHSFYYYIMRWRVTRKMLLCRSHIARYQGDCDGQWWEPIKRNCQSFAKIWSEGNALSWTIFSSVLLYPNFVHLTS